MITAEYCFPPNSGGKIYTYNNIRLLNEHDIYLYTFIDNENEVDKKIDLTNVVLTKYYKRKSKLSIVFNLYKPIGAFTRMNRKMMVDIENLCDKQKIDLIILEWPQLYYNLSKSLKIMVICMFQNIESNLLYSIYKKEKNIIKKLAYYREFSLLRKLEEKINSAQNINGFTFISYEDKRIFEERYKISKNTIVLQPYIVNKAIHNKKNGTDDKNTFNISFIGKMNYQCNIQGAEWFAKKVYKRIREKIPNVRLYLVGKDPSKRVMQLETEGIIVTGTVQDISSYYYNSDIIVIPLLSGGGIKLKILEAALYGKIVIATSLAIQGTGLKDNIHLKVADNSEEFANICIDILSNRQKYNYLINNFKAYVNDNFSEESMSVKLNAFVNSF